LYSKIPTRQIHALAASHLVKGRFMLNSVQKVDVKDDGAAVQDAADGADLVAIERRKVIEATLASIRPNLQRDKGIAS